MAARLVAIKLGLNLMSEFSFLSCCRYFGRWNSAWILFLPVMWRALI